jgi:two-component system, response regulator
VPEKTMDVLLVEDTRDDIDLISAILKQQHPNIHLEVVQDGTTALDYLFATGAYTYRQTANTPALILLDLELPKVKGLEILRILKAYSRTKAIPVVMLSSSEQDKNVVDSYELGANSFVRKPANYEDFRRAIQAIGMYWLSLNQPNELQNPNQETGTSESVDASGSAQH